jgi:hypothetical protein
MAHPSVMSTVLPLGFPVGRLSFIDGGRAVVTGRCGAWGSVIEISFDHNRIFLLSCYSYDAPPL